MRTWNTRDTVHISYNSVANHGRILNNLRVEEKHIYACFSFTLNPCLAELEVFHIAFWTKYSLLDSCPQYCCQQLDGSHMMTNINDKKETWVTSSKGYWGVDTRLQTITKTPCSKYYSVLGRYTHVWPWKRSKRTGWSIRSAAVHAASKRHFEVRYIDP